MLRIQGFIKRDGIVETYGDIKYTANVDEAKEHLVALFDTLELLCSNGENNEEWFEVIAGTDREID